MTIEASRVEHDTMGAIEVPAEAYYGAQTARAVQNFPISGLRLPPSFVRTLGLIKAAAAETNLELGLLKPDKAGAIAQAATEVARGQLTDEFPIDVFQTGSGTSTNTNANEVIACRANELLGAERSTRGPVHPNDDVNLGQSSNDVIPTAIHLSAMIAIQRDLLPSLHELHDALQRKAQEFWPIVKTGRTHLQDATPIRLGQEFQGYAEQIALSIERCEAALASLGPVALGGTAVGTGVNTHPDFARLATQRLRASTDTPIHETSRHFMAQSTLDTVAAASGALRTVAVSLMKIANDIRWMGSGPRAGIGELALPAVQPGSSIMPGKVNPVIAESVTMVSAQVIGYDVTITIACQSGNFELNVMLPLVAYDLLQSIDLLTSSARNFARLTVEGLKATERGPEMVENGLMLATALTPAIGYDAAAAIAKEAAATGETVRQVARRRTNLPETELDSLLNAESMTAPRPPSVSG